MKRLGGVWPRIVTFENLLASYRKARRGKGRTSAVASFALNLEQELISLQRDLVSETYHPGKYRLFTIYERKPRLISAAPFRDRVVHHAVMGAIEPSLDRRFIHDSYACRPGKGVHRAIDRYQGWARRYRYTLKMDVSRYFPSIDREILKGKLHRQIKDKALLRVLDLIIDSGISQDIPQVWFPGDTLLAPAEHQRGIPIGNLTSQFFANLYLNDLDHFIKETLGVRAYLRYVDDMVVLGDDKGQLREVLAAVQEHLAGERLCLHPHKSHIRPTRSGLDLLGYHVFPHARLLRNDNGHRFARKLRGFARGYQAGRLSWEDFNPSVQSWIGHARYADTDGLRKKIFSATLFAGGTGH